MSRSVWKGPFVDPSLIKKVEKLKNQANPTPIKTWWRKSTIIPEFVGISFLIYNGKKFIPIKISEAFQSIVFVQSNIYFCNQCFFKNPIQIRREYYFGLVLSKPSYIGAFFWILHAKQGILWVLPCGRSKHTGEVWKGSEIPRGAKSAHKNVHSRHSGKKKHCLEQVFFRSPVHFGDCY